ncbi:hypothetical protein E5288_WYG022260 [Bos mutus]|uniref:Uncharacterized protein n=1 Tax=Bos mutus TaxID=72004 RepID=A0A6B0S0N2_9CETA|nr:hypothetical protein [Bos mutus]
MAAAEELSDTRCSPEYESQTPPEPRGYQSLTLQWAPHGSTVDGAAPSPEPTDPDPAGKGAVDSGYRSFGDGLVDCLNRATWLPPFTETRMSTPADAQKRKRLQ